MKNYILVIDEGTTGVRSIIFDKQLNIISKAYEKLNLLYPRPDFIEQSADELYEKTVKTLRDSVAKGGIDPKEIECIGISTQRVTWVPWRRGDDKPLMNMATWMDKRGIPKFLELKKNKEFEAQFPEMFGALQPQQIACGLTWQLENNKELEKLHREGELQFGTVDTWIVYKLTKGKVFASDASNAGTTRLIDNRTLDWNRDAMKFLGLSPDMFAQVKNEADDYGLLDKDILGVEIPITGVVADQQSALFSQACLTPWSVKSTNGTGSFVTFNLGDKYIPAKGAYANIIGWKLKDQVRFMTEGFLPTAGAALEWLKDNLHMINDFDEVNEICRNTPDSAGVYFSPALNGFRAPLNDATARAGFMGMTGSTTKEHCVRAVVESIAFANAHVIEDVRRVFSIPKLDKIRLSGGVAKENLLGQMISNITECKVEKPQSLEASAIGAAEFAGLYTGTYNLEDIERFITVEKVFEPNEYAEKDKKTFENWKEAILRTTQWGYNIA